MSIFYHSPDDPPSPVTFAQVVFKHWVALLGGGVIIVVLGLTERVGQVSVPLPWYLGILFLMIVLASYLAWSNERHRVINQSGEMLRLEHRFEDANRSTKEANTRCLLLEQELADERSRHDIDIHGEMELRWLADAEHGGQRFTSFTVLMVVRNAGSPTSLTDWYLTVTLPNGQTFNVPPYFPDGMTLGTDGQPDTVIKVHDFIPMKTVEPIKSGALVRGYLFFPLPLPFKDAYQKGTTLRVCFTDIRGNKHFADHEINPENHSRHAIPGIIPGVDPLILTNTQRKKVAAKKKKRFASR